MDISPMAYEALNKWIHDNGYEISGPLMEQYLINIAHSSDENTFVTRILFPIKSL